MEWFINHRNGFLPVLEAGKTVLEMLVDSVSTKDTFTSWFVDSDFSLSSPDRRNERALWGLSCKGTNPHPEGSAQGPQVFFFIVTHPLMSFEVAMYFFVWLVGVFHWLCFLVNASCNPPPWIFSSRPRVLIPSLRELGFQHMHLGGVQTFRPKHMLTLIKKKGGYITNKVNFRA